MIGGQLGGRPVRRAGIIGSMDTSAPFGVKNSRSFLVLDKSFLDAVSSVQLQYYVQQGWTFGITDVLMHELLRKRDKWRIKNLFKLHKIESNLRMLPGIGPMFHAETNELRPASQILRAKRVKFVVKKGPSGEFFEMDRESMRSIREKAAELDERVDDLTEVWHEFEKIPELKNAGQKEMLAAIRDLSKQIRDDREDMRGVYGRHRHPSFPAPELLDEDWAFFRWIQVHLLAGLSFYASYGVDKTPNREKLVHEVLDLSYLIPALLVGGLACRENRFHERFRLLRPDGVLLRN